MSLKYSSLCNKQELEMTNPFKTQVNKVSGPEVRPQEPRYVVPFVCNLPKLDTYITRPQILI
jgi:hypothetical protein